MFTDHWNDREIEVKNKLFKHSYILAKDFEQRRYIVLELSGLDNKSEEVIRTDYLEECLSVL